MMQGIISSFLKLGIIIAVVVVVVYLLAGSAYILDLLDATNPNHSNSGSVSSTLNSNYYDNNMPANIENEIINQITSTGITYVGNGDYKFDIDLDEKINAIYDKLSQTDEGRRVLDYLKGTESEKKELLKKMVRAEIYTQYPDLRSRDKIGTAVNSNEIQGTIKIKRMFSQEVKKVKSFEKSSNTAVDLTGIVCWGDQYTLGNESDDTDNYPSKLAEKLNTNVYNLGFKDETIEEILLRAGADGFKFQTSGDKFTIGAGIGSTAEFSALLKVDDENKGRIFTNSDGSSDDKKVKCSIGGIEGLLTFDRSSRKYTFTRTSDGDEQEIESATEIKVETQSGYEECIPILWLGHNNYDLVSSNNTTYTYINYCNDLINKLDNPENYIIIIPTQYNNVQLQQTPYTDSQYNELKDKLIETFGIHCIDLKAEGWDIGSSYDDLAEIIKNKIASLGYDVGEKDEKNAKAGEIEYDGTIGIGEEITLEYIPLGNSLEPQPGTLRWMIKQEDDDIKNAALQFFSMDSLGNLIVANWARVTTTHDNQSDSNGGRDSYTYDEGYPIVDVVYTLNTVKVNYKSSVSKYTMPFDYLWTFMIMGEDSEFVENLADLALESKIEATLYDELTTVENDRVDEYTTAYNNHVKEESHTTVTTVNQYNGNIISTDGGTSTREYDVTPNPAETDTKQRVNVVTETNKVKYRVTYADVWMLTYRVDGVEQIHYDGREQDSVSIPGGSGSGQYEIEKKENFTIPSQRGTNIYATSIVPKDCENPPLVILAHGFTGKKEGDDDHFIKIGEAIAKSGIAAIMIDFPGCGRGRSEEPSTNYTLTNMENDINSAVEYMKNTYSIDENQIGIVGHSMGGRVASEYLDNSGVKVAALLSPANGDGINGLEFLADSTDTTTLIEASKVSPWNFEVSADFVNQMSSSHPQSKISSFLSSGGKIFVAYGTEDNVIGQGTKDAVKSAVASSDYHEYSGGNHNLDQYSSDSSVSTKIVDDVAKFLCDSFGKEMSSSSAGTNLTDLYNQTVENITDESSWTTYNTTTSNSTSSNSSSGTTTTVETTTTTDYQKRIINRAITTTVIKSGYTYTEGTSHVEEKTDKEATDDEIEKREFSEPNFVKYYLYSLEARANLTGTYSWLYEALEMNGRTSEFVDITKYMIYKATGADQGVTSFDFNAYNDSDFHDATDYGGISGGGGIIGDITMGDSGLASGGALLGAYVGGVAPGEMTGEMKGTTDGEYWNTYRRRDGREFKLYCQNGAQTCLDRAKDTINSGFQGQSCAELDPSRTMSIEQLKPMILECLQNGGAVVMYADFNKGTSSGGNVETFYGSDARMHAIAILDIDESGHVFISNPYYESDGNGGQKAGGWSQFTLYELMDTYPDLKDWSSGAMIRARYFTIQ